jgi:hypothetical protein
MKYKVSKSKIPNADKGLFAKNKLDRGERIGLAHRDGQPVGTIGNMHNHSDNPNMRSIKVGNERYVYAIRDIEPGEELTTDYRMQPELEQPEDFMRKGGRTRGLVAMPKPSKKGLASKKYSRSLSATNRLFAVNPLFKKPKSRKNKIFDPNAKYYQDGGVNRTKLAPDEEMRFQKFYKSLPGNLQTDDDTYDLRGYWDSEKRPESFNYEQPTDDEGYYHAYSINSNTGEYLKSPAHETFQHAVDEDRKIGYRPLTNVYGRNIATENESIADPEQQSFLRNTEGPANYIETELTPEEIEQYRKGGYIVEEVTDPSVPTLNRFTNGGGPGDDLEKNLQEVTIYDPKTKKEQLNLFEQLRVAKEAYQNYTKQNKGKKWTLNAADPLSSSISDLKKQIQLYKDEFKKEKEETERELKRLESLKGKSVFKNNKDIQNLTLKDLSTVKGKAKLLDAVRSSNLSGNEVSAIYTGWGLDQADYNVKRGYGPDKDYSAIETKAAAMKDVPQFVDMVSKVATAIPLIGAAGALAPAAGATLSNPIVQGAMAAPSIAEIALHPQDTITGIATTGVEAYDKLMGDEDDVNRFGNPYWQDMDDLLNTVMLIPGIKSIGAARNFLKTPTGFNFAKNYIKPVKDVYKGAVKTIKQKTAPIFDANVPKTIAATADMLTGGRGATEVVNTAGAVLKNAPAWAEPTVGNVLKSFTLANATGQAIEGVSNVTKGFSEGDKEKFDQGFAEATDAVTTLAQVSKVPELSDVTTPLVMLTTANEIKDNVKKDEKVEAAFNLLRFVNQTRSLPISRTRILPTKTVRAFKHIKPKHIRSNIKKIQKGGIVTTMSKAEIDDYIKRGYIVEELD